MTHSEVLKHPFLANKEAKSLSKLEARSLKSKKSKLVAFGSFLLNESNAIMLSTYEMMPLDEIQQIIESLHEETKDVSSIPILNDQPLEEEEDAEVSNASTWALSSFENISLDAKEINSKKDTI